MLKLNLLKSILCLVILSPVIKAQTEKDIEVVRTAFLTATQNADSLDFQKYYFDVFPKTFESFRNTFGYFENRDPQQTYAGGLSTDADKYISLFFRLKNVPDAEFYTKLIDLGINGQWHKDAENKLQSGMRKKVLQNPKMVFELLKNETDADVESFWFFFFSGKHEPYKTIPEKLSELRSGNNKVYYLLQKGFEAASKANAHK